MGEVSASQDRSRTVELARRGVARAASRSCRCFCSRRAAFAFRRPISARPWSPRSMPRSLRCAGMYRSSASSPAWCGCFGGMSISCRPVQLSGGLSAGLELELNGPEVIEQEAGIDELDRRRQTPDLEPDGRQQRL